MKLKMYIYCFLLGCVICAGCLPAIAEVKIVADGGNLRSAFVPRFMFTELTLTAEGARGVGSLSGSLSHPYGEGEFELNVNSRYVMDASVSIFSTHISFSMKIADNFPNKAYLFKTKPVPGVGNETDYYDFDRPGSFQMDYPYFVEWLDFHAEDFMGNEVSAELFTDAILIVTDIGGGVYVDEVGFDSPSSEIFITAVNDVPLFPYRQMSQSRGGRFFRGGNDVGIDVAPYLPLTFLVRQEDGTEHVIRHQHESSEIILSPVSAVIDYELYE